MHDLQSEIASGSTSIPWRWIPPGYGYDYLSAQNMVSCICTIWEIQQGWKSSLQSPRFPGNGGSSGLPLLGMPATTFSKTAWVARIFPWKQWHLFFTDLKSKFWHSKLKRKETMSEQYLEWSLVQIILYTSHNWEFIAPIATTMKSGCTGLNFESWHMAGPLKDYQSA